MSHETIYQTLFVQARGGLRKDSLPVCVRDAPHAAPTAAHAATGHFPEMAMISERPAEVEDRAVPGHWEGDLIMGPDNRSAIATLVERSTRYVLLRACQRPHHTRGHRRPAAQIQTLPTQLTARLTWDQGTEMAGHTPFTITTGDPGLLL